MTTRYRDPAGELHEAEWIISLLLLEGAPIRPPQGADDGRANAAAKASTGAGRAEGSRGGGDEQAVRESGQEAPRVNGPSRKATTTNTATAGKRLRPHAAFWLIVADGDECSDALTLDLPGRGEALAVFGHPEEAEMFLWLGQMGRGWRSREASPRSSPRCSPGPARASGGSRWTRSRNSWRAASSGS